MLETSNYSRACGLIPSTAVSLNLRSNFGEYKQNFTYPEGKSWLRCIDIPEFRTSWIAPGKGRLNHLKPTGHVMHQQFNIQQLYVLSTLYLCVLYLSENKQQLVPLTA